MQNKKGCQFCSLCIWIASVKCRSHRKQYCTVILYIPAISMTIQYRQFHVHGTVGHDAIDSYSGGPRRMTARYSEILIQLITRG